METITIILSIVLLMFCILQIILFFKLWKMTNDTTKILDETQKITKHLQEIGDNTNKLQKHSQETSKSTERITVGRDVASPTASRNNSVTKEKAIHDATRKQDSPEIAVAKQEAIQKFQSGDEIRARHILVTRAGMTLSQAMDFLSGLGYGL